MSTLKQRLCRKNDTGSYDIIQFETSSDLVLRTDGTSVENSLTTMANDISNKAAKDHTHPAQTTVTGNAGTATKLATGRTIRTNLASTSAPTFDGSANVTPGVTGILSVANGGTGVNSLDKLKESLGVTSASKPSTTINVGSEITMAAFDWICVHQDTNYYYLMTKYVIGGTSFAVPFNNTDKKYSGSQAALICSLFGAAIGVWGNNAFGNITVEGVTGYCHLATLTQMNGGFSYFNNSSKRIARDNAGTACTYWLSSMYTDATIGNRAIYYVNTGGNITNTDSVNLSYGFRPFVALKK